MRALFVVNAPVYGGGHNQIAVLRRPLAERGWETLALVPDEPGTARERLADQGVEVVTLPMNRLRATFDPRTNLRFLARLWPDVRAIRELLRERRIDVVQAHGVTHPHAPLAGHLEGRAVVWELYDTRAPMFLRKAGMPLVTRVADVTTSWGRELARLHPGAESLGERLVTVYPPVDADEFRPDATRRSAARRRLAVPEGSPLVGSVGNLNPQKGHEYLIDAAVSLRERHPRTRFRVIGGPGAVHAAYHERLEARARAAGLTEGAFEFTGPMSEIAEVLPGFDALAITSVPHSEGIPTVILEAMACGVPVVSTDVGAVRELVRHGVTGLLTPPRDVAAIASALERLVTDADLRRSMGTTAREDVLRTYDLERCADRRVHAFELAVSTRQNR